MGEEVGAIASSRPIGLDESDDESEDNNEDDPEEEEGPGRGNKLEELEALEPVEKYDEIGEFEDSMRTILSLLTQSFWRRLDNLDKTQVAAITKEPHARVTPEDLAKRWRIGLQIAKQTLGVTTQLGIRHAVNPLTRRYRTDFLHSSNARRIEGKWYGDTLFSKCTSYDE